MKCKDKDAQNSQIVRIICVAYLSIRRAVVLIQVRTRTRAQDYGTSLHKSKAGSAKGGTERSEVSR